MEWLNQDVRNERYYRADQTARITVQERNFVPEQVQLSLTGRKPEALLWAHRGGKGCKGSSSYKDLNHRDDCTWTAELVFDKDGVYTFGFSCQDAAGNQGNYERTDTFVIDKTPPVVKVHWDDSKAVNGHYYSKGRAAVVEITERNLSPEDVKVMTEAFREQEAVSGPEMGQLRRWEENSWRAGIAFEKDGRYRLKATMRCISTAA